MAGGEINNDGGANNAAEMTHEQLRAEAKADRLEAFKDRMAAEKDAREEKTKNAIASLLNKSALESIGDMKRAYG